MDKKTPGKWNWRSILLSSMLTLLGIACFPVNPLVLSGMVTTGHNRVLDIIGWIVWGIGMVLVMAPIVMFPLRGGVARGKAFVHTTRLVDTGIYRIVRHPQYLGGILALFITTFLWYPHWLFALLGITGTTIIYLGCVEEDQRLIRKFGEDYRSYMQKVTRINLIVGIIRLIRKRKN